LKASLKLSIKARRLNYAGLVVSACVNVVARRGRNPKTGDPVSIPAKRVPYFKPGKELKELINDDNASAPSSTGGSSSLAGDGRQPPVL
jgi:hypothetical protein